MVEDQVPVAADGAGDRDELAEAWVRRYRYPQANHYGRNSGSRLLAIRGQLSFSVQGGYSTMRVSEPPLLPSMNIRQPVSGTGRLGSKTWSFDSCATL